MNSRLDQNTQTLTVTLAVVCAYARLHELEAKRSQTSPIDRLQLGFGLSGEQEQEYAALMKWWNAMGTDKRMKLFDIVQSLAHEAHLLASMF